MLPPVILWFPFSTLTDWFVENELVYILVGTKQNSLSLLQNIDKKLVVLDECLTGESMAMKVYTKITSKVNFLHRKKQVSIERLKEAVQPCME